LALAIGDALALALMQLRGFNPENFAQNHPGGSLGKKLNLKVRDVMHGGQGGTAESLPVVLADASMDEVLVTSTRHKLGAVLVVQSQKEWILLGIITDGDLRRALQHREKFFGMKAREVMTANPVTVSAEMMAKAALDLMENRPSQIGVLPVVSEAGGKLCVGVVRLHDLVRAF
jgi:arabinose-5-phosphate isomerase